MFVCYPNIRFNGNIFMGTKPIRKWLHIQTLFHIFASQYYIYSRIYYNTAIKGLNSQLMKNSTLIALALLAIGASTADAQTKRHYRLHTPSPLATAKAKASTLYDLWNAKPQKPKHAAEKKNAYLPKQQTEYMYMDGEWLELGTYSFTYDEKGREACIDNNDGETITRTEKTWTDDGQLATQTESTSEDGGTTFTPTAKRVQTYDRILPQLTLTKDKYEWDDTAGDWITNYDSFHRTIVRDADQNVTSLTLAVPYEGRFDDTQRITNTFSQQTKQAETFMFEELEYDGSWSRKQYLRNLVWDKTNGQLVDQYDSWMTYGNYLLSGSIADNDPDTGELTDFGKIDIAYLDGNGYVETINYTDVLSKSVTRYHETDNGGYTYEYKYYEDMNGDGVLDDTDIADQSKETASYDEYGNIVSTEEYGMNEDTGELELNGATRYDYTYDTEHDNAVAEMVVNEYDYDSKEYVPTMKIVTTEYTQTATAIDNVKDNGASLGKDMYTISGTKVDNTNCKGIYIVRRGGKLVKMMR